MHLKKHSYHTFALLLFIFIFCGFNKCGCTDDYISQDKKGYYTENRYVPSRFDLFEKTISILEAADDITNLRKKLKDNIKKWCTAGTEKKPYEIFHTFFTDAVQVNIVEALRKKYDTTLLENYYDRVGNLFKEPTEANEKEVIATVSKLQANSELMKAIKAYIEANYHNPTTLYLNKPTLEYQELLYFILGKSHALHINLIKLHSNLSKWKEDGHPAGLELWKETQKTYDKLLKGSKFYGYTENREAINNSLRLMNQLADSPYGLSYKDLLETLPHGVDKLKNILYEVRLEEKKDIRLLKTYLELVNDVCTVL